MDEKLSIFPAIHGLICPNEFWRSFGYDGAARYLAIWWEQCGDEAAWHDGRTGVVGAFWPAYKALLEHNFSPGHPYHWLLGDSDTPAVFRLVIDRYTEDAWLVPGDQADEILLLQWLPAPTDAVGELNVPAEDLDLLIANLVSFFGERHDVTIESVEAAIAQEERDYQALSDALAARPSSWRKQEVLDPVT